MSRAQIDVALLNFAYWPEVRRGSERLVHDLSLALADAGHRPRIVTSHPGKTSRLVEDGVQVVRLRRPSDRLLQRRRFQPNLTHIPLSYAELRRRPPDVAHAFFVSDGLAAGRWSRVTGRPAVFSFMGIPGRENLSNLRLRLRSVEAILRDCAAVTALSRAAAEGTRRWTGIEPRVIYPGVDLTRFTPGQRATEPTISCAADPGDPRKRVRILVDAFRLVRRQRSKARLVLMRPTDPGSAAELAAIPGIELMDPGVDNAAEVFRSAWASALCSRREAFGLVLVESLACGTPVVGARDGAIPEIIDRQEVGRLFDGDDPGVLARELLATLELAEDSDTERRCRARAQDFSIERCAREHARLYYELIEAA